MTTQRIDGPNLPAPDTTCYENTTCPKCGRDLWDCNTIIVCPCCTTDLKIEAWKPSPDPQAVKPKPLPMPAPPPRPSLVDEW